MYIYNDMGLQTGSMEGQISTFTRKTKILLTEVIPQNLKEKESTFIIE